MLGNVDRRDGIGRETALHLAQYLARSRVEDFEARTALEPFPVDQRTRSYQAGVAKAREGIGMNHDKGGAEAHCVRRFFKNASHSPSWDLRMNSSAVCACAISPGPQMTVVIPAAW
ncbi:hypothetical protein D9M68_804450 [compost metagenome]